MNLDFFFGLFKLKHSLCCGLQFGNFSINFYLLHFMLYDFFSSSFGLMRRSSYFESTCPCYCYHFDHWIQIVCAFSKIGWNNYSSDIFHWFFVVAIHVLLQLCNKEEGVLLTCHQPILKNWLMVLLEWFGKEKPWLCALFLVGNSWKGWWCC